jgi:hypothetical protein
MSNSPTQLYKSAVSPSSLPLPPPVSTLLPSCLALSSIFCLSLTFLGFFALTGPSALLSFHYFASSAFIQGVLPLSLSPPNASKNEEENSPSLHTYTKETVPQALLHLLRLPRRFSNMRRDRRNAIVLIRRSGSARGLGEGCCRGCMISVP